eukprot:1907820-Rhodomonas_salina.1
MSSTPVSSSSGSAVAYSRASSNGWPATRSSTCETESKHVRSSVCRNEGSGCGGLRRARRRHVSREFDHYELAVVAQLGDKHVVGEERCVRVVRVAADEAGVEHAAVRGQRVTCLGAQPRAQRRLAQSVLVGGERLLARRAAGQQRREVQRRQHPQVSRHHRLQLRVGREVADL